MRVTSTPWSFSSLIEIIMMFHHRRC